MRINKSDRSCPNCKYENSSFLLNDVSNHHRDIKYGTRTEFEFLLASALKKERIEFKANPLVRLSACEFYTVDFLIRRRLIVEVDGGIHDADYRKTPDRICQRALEKLGYTVYRVRNETVKSSPQKVAAQVLQQYFEISDVQTDQSRPSLSKAKNIENFIPSEPKNARLSSAAKMLKRSAVEWNYENYRTYMSEIDRDFLIHPCLTERLLLSLMGLELTTNDEGSVNFKSYFNFFMSGLTIMSKLYGNLARIYLINSFNISVANFMKNLIFYGGPRIKPGLVLINSIESLQNHISEFNNHFSGIGVRLEMDDLKSECKSRVERLNSVTREKYLWLLNWIEQDTAKK